jgi:hypothetical protein
MPDYRVYVVTDEGRVMGPAEIITCNTDQEATERARLVVNGHDVELWEGAKRVTRIKSGEV